MSTKVLIEGDPKHEAFLRRALALAEEMEQLALTAPDGAVFVACEQAVIDKGRNLQAQLLAAAVARRIQAAEKKGRRSAGVRADG
jgi:tRNA(Arg) A34 adenosine deaminase TadA